MASNISAGTQTTWNYYHWWWVGRCLLSGAAVWRLVSLISKVRLHHGHLSDPLVPDGRGPAATVTIDETVSNGRYPAAIPVQVVVLALP